MAIFRSEAFLQWLARHQVLGPQVRRVIIDAEVGKPVRMYVEQFVDSDVLVFEPPTELREAAISFAPRASGDAEDALRAALSSRTSEESGERAAPPGAHPDASQTG